VDYLVANLVATGCQRAQQHRSHPVRRFANQRRHHAAVDVHRGAHLEVPEQLHDHAGVKALGQQECGRCVPSVMQPNMSDAGSSQEFAPVLVVGLLVDRPDVRLDEDEVLVVPLVGRQHAFTGLQRLVLVQCESRCVGKSDRSFAAPCLRRLVDQAAL
jgi:hypothetical protein